MRNQNLDIFRGIATINIILIHTIWWSGQSYTPIWLKQACLTFEVPVFLFISGWSFSHHSSLQKGIRGLIDFQIKYFWVLAFAALFFLFIGKGISIELFFDWLFHNHYERAEGLWVLFGSFWFIKTYYLASIFGIILIDQLSKRTVIVITLLLFLLQIYFLEYDGAVDNNLIWGVSIQNVVFYLFMFILGYLTKDFIVNLVPLVNILAVISIALYVISVVQPVNIFDLQTHKFHYNLVYLLWSLPGVLLILYFKRFELSSKRLSFIGRNAVFFYFIQGVTSTLLYIIIPSFPVDFLWYQRFICAAFINILMCSAGVFVIKKLQDGYSFSVGKLKARFIKVAA